MDDPILSLMAQEDGGFEARPAEVRPEVDQVELIPIQGLLGIELPDGAQRTKMKEVWDFFAKDAQGQGDALYRIKQTEIKMSPPKLGESRLGKLYNYVKLQNQMSSIEQELVGL